MVSSSLARLASLVAALGAINAYAFDNSRNDNVAAYWGQNSYGAGGGAQANWQKPIDFYCQDDSIDAFPVAFVNVFFGAGGLPSLDLANICSVTNQGAFPGTQLPDCSFLASAIQTCQSKGKIVTISLGGESGAAGSTSAAQASTFADTVWNVFLGGSSSTRPFGNAVLDGVDLDIEGGSTTYFDSFINQLRTHMNSASKKYYITAAPQCPFPDAYLGGLLNEVAVDAVYVQFYNNWCQLSSYDVPNAFDFAQWDTWAKTQAPNKNVKIYLGAAASSTAAHTGYAPIDEVTQIINDVKSQYSSFGGVMFWDASQAYNNNRFDAAVKAALRNGASAPPPPPPTSSPTTAPPTTTPPATTPPSGPTTTTTTTTSSPVSSPPATGGSCAGVNAWVANVSYNGGDKAVYNGHLWTAKWWSYGDTPGGSAGDWQDDGACTASALKAGAYIQAHYESKSVPTSVPVQTPADAAPKNKNSRFFYSA